MTCNNCMQYRPDFGSTFTCPECNQKFKLAGVGPGNYWEEDGPMTTNPKLKDVSLDRFLLESNRRNKISELREQIKNIQNQDFELSRLTGIQLDVEIEYRKEKKSA